jgi:hypothetical protein
MPTKGTPAVRVRIPLELQARVQAQIDSRNLWTAQDPWCFSDFVRVALERELAKMARSRRPRRRRRPGRSAELVPHIADALCGEG